MSTTIVSMSYICNNISSVVEFQRWWILHSKIFGQHSRTNKIRKILSMNVSLSKIGHDFSNKVVQKFTLEKNVFTKKWSPNVKFTIEIFLKKFFQFMT